MKHMINKHFPITTIKMAVTITQPQPQQENLPKSPPPAPKKYTFRKFFNFISPFIILIVFILIASGVYYAVEHECETNFYCPRSSLIIIDSDGNHTSKSEMNEIKQKYSAEIPTTNYWEAIHFISISVTTIGKFACSDL